MIENQAEEQQEAVEDQLQIEVTEDPVEPQAQGGDDEERQQAGEYIGGGAL